MQAQNVAALSNPAYQNNTGADRTANRQGVLVSILVLGEAVPRNDSDTRYLRKAMDDPPVNTYWKKFQVGIRK
jgi:hypothetical protein